MIRITHKQYKRKVDTWRSKYLNDKHTELVDVVTLWFLFIPIWSRNKIVVTTVSS